MTARAPRPHAPAPARKGARQPIHVGIAFGVVAGVYAASLAAVSSFQASADAAKEAAAREAAQPAADAAARLTAAHDALDQRLVQAESSYNDAVTAYQAAMDRIAANEATVGQLSHTLRSISRSAANVSIPQPVQVTSRLGGSRIQTITVTRTTTVTRGTHTTTSASGKP